MTHPREPHSPEAADHRAPTGDDPTRAPSQAHDLNHFIERGRSRATLDERSPEEIVGYDANGLPS
ncbi:MAG: hypothetical protein Q4F65_02610 [Propionibacteriaceae bacterium]|nr:hypothetical protein [Propionibacteriaceae bacterium]